MVHVWTFSVMQLLWDAMNIERVLFVPLMMGLLKLKHRSKSSELLTVDTLCLWENVKV